MTLAISMLIIVLAAAYVALPFLSVAAAGESAAPASGGPTDRQRMERQKLDAYTAIKEAEFDYRMGKLSDADYALLRDKYAAQAVEAMAALDAPAAAVPRQLSLRKPTRIAFCPACGRGVPPRANFCPACGRSLKEAVA